MFEYLQKLQNCCNGNPRLKELYLYNCSLESHDQNTKSTIWKSRSSTFLYSANPKHNSHSDKHYIELSWKWPNIATVLEPTVITYHITPSLFPTSMNTLTLTRMEWLKELLTGHPVCFYDAFGMSKHVFWKLVHELVLHAGLAHSRYICIEEQVAMFLCICKTDCTVCNLGKHFQHSPATISKWAAIPCIKIL